MPVSVTERAILSFLSRCLTLLLGKVTVETSRYGHLSITGSFQCPDKILVYFLKKKKPSIIRTLSNTDNGH